MISDSECTRKAMDKNLYSVKDKQKGGYNEQSINNRGHLWNRACFNSTFS